MKLLNIFGSGFWFTLSWFTLSIALLASPATGEQRYPASGLLLQVNPAENTITVSCKEISGFMDAMVMPISVRDPKQLVGLSPGAMIEFTLVVEKQSSYATAVRVLRYESLEQEPLQARRLGLLQSLADPTRMVPLAVGTAVPDFKLVDQKNRPVSLSQFKGKVVALNFVYTRCPLPEYCYRMVNNFGRLQKRFGARLGRDLVLLTVSFDPVHDQPEVLAQYASAWKANPETWHFLTGPPTDVDRLCKLFGVDSWQDEGVLTHTLHTAIIDRNGALAANIEGNQFTPSQLGDLVESVLGRAR